MDAKTTTVGLKTLPSEIKALILDALPPKAYLAMGQVDRDWFEQTHSAYRLQRQITALPDCCQARVRVDTQSSPSDVATLSNALAKSTRAQFCHKSAKTLGDFWAHHFDCTIDVAKYRRGERTWGELLDETEFLQHA